MTTSTGLDGVRVDPKSGGSAKQLMIILHGYGADGADMASLAQFWMHRFPDMGFVMPNGPAPCDINPAGYQWFPLDEIDPMTMGPGADGVRPVIEGFVKAELERTGLGSEDLILAGFSQGAMMALDVALRRYEAVKGVVSFSGSLVAPNSIATNLRSRPPVCLVHGAEDDVVPAAASSLAHRLLGEMDVNSRLLIAENTGHSIPMDGLGFATLFLTELISGVSPEP
ncbi:alpha/beta hydrolase [Cucumibacter marinus]|uniref:alpha/beta hydrolase n=1 Tax=Cucumibacter marinus TaxID=1121252 RepID=UPI00040225EA|nr:dienelactone hydrolase family protein [Cucumibacter marinus]